MVEDTNDIFLRKDENDILNNLTSFNFVRVHTNSRSIVKEKCVLFKARRIYENELVRLLKSNSDGRSALEEEKIKETLNNLYLKLGHVHLLAHDYARAHSAYQKALSGMKDKFWREPSGLFGLGLIYFHFRSYKVCIESFNKLLYSHPYIEVTHEVHARLGLAHKSLENYSQALKHLQIALDDLRESTLLPKPQLRFHIAHCYDSSDDLKRATDEYKKLLLDQTVQSNPSLHASILRQLGWICYRTECLSQEQRAAKVKEAEQLLLRSKEIEPNHGRTFYYLGRCYSELPDRAHDAFTHYRQAIDKSEGDADTWCSIGVLYHHQQQDTDALQAFVCAIQLNPEHSASWTDLGRLYETHSQFQEALFCYKKAVKFNPVAPEALKARIQVLDKELSATQVIGNATNNTHNRIEKLDSLEDAWRRGIPAELGPRQRELVKNQQFRYREGSPLWGMSELLNYSLQKPFSELDNTQREILKILKLNQEFLEHNELNLLTQLEARYPLASAVPGPSNISTLPKPKEDLPFASDDLEDVLGDTTTMLKNETLDSELQPVEGKTTSDFDAFAHPSTAGTSTSEPKQPNEKQEEIQEEKISSTSGDLPPTFSLLSKVNVPITVTSSEIFEMVKKRHEKPGDYRPIFDEIVEPPKIPELPKIKPLKEQLVLPTPLIQVESVRDAHAPELQKFCYMTPIALIRGLTAALKIDLSHFSTKSLIETAPDHPVEIRTQYKMPGDANLDQLGHPTWSCYSMPSHSTISRYGNYQAESFRYSLKEETEKLRQAASTSKYVPQTTSTSSSSAYNATIQNGSLDNPPSAKKRKMPGHPDENIGHMPTKVIKFGTNVDLSDEAVFRNQLRELDKMPAFCRIVAGCNLLTHLGHTVLGMNSVQLYMKVPGCRTPGHLENNRFASININIGPGECEWFGLPSDYWPAIEKLCRERNLDFLKGSWWPNFDDLIKEGVPVYRFTQKAGDLVWVGGGCVHWVQSIGWCNNIAWNVGPMTAEQMEMALEAHEWNKLHVYRSLVPMQHLCWQLASNVRFSNQRMFNVIKNVLIRSLAYMKMVVNFVHSTMKSPIKSQPRVKGEGAHYCHQCEVEVFNILFVKEINNKFHVFCVQCARRSNLDDYVVLQQQTFEELAGIFDQFQLHPAKSTLVC